MFVTQRVYQCRLALFYLLVGTLLGEGLGDEVRAAVENAIAISARSFVTKHIL
jgi:hypothetical protein